jgi:hypothetical protein
MLQRRLEKYSNATRRGSVMIIWPMQHALNSYGTVPMICIEITLQFADTMNHLLCDILDKDIDRIAAAPADRTKRKLLKHEAETLEKAIGTIRGLF